MTAKSTVLIVGGTGAQGAVITRILSETNKYSILVFTRSTTSAHAQELAALPNVELVQSKTDAGYDLDAFYETAKRADSVFINTDGFALGEMAETFWGIRLFETSARAGVKHVIYSGLDSNGKPSGYNPDLYVGHYEGKARVQEWIKSQGKDGRMAWTILRSGPYAESLHEALRPQFTPDGTAVFALPIGDEGEIPFVGLEDFGHYVDWALAHRDEANGQDIGLAIEFTSLAKLAAAYTAATGKPATWKSIPAKAWNDVAWAKLPDQGATKIGYMSISDPKALNLTYDQNFTNWFNLYRSRILKRDFDLLDRILPERDSSIEGWMRRVGYTGEPKTVLRSMRNPGRA
ncbi:hypothetical protein G7054_g9037 [Neopestalotiopsis clavispora]|nr:hypothetical protein G7054_g9037 [Neopestalotiopsis clavispora]